jgi:hypothetical protein
LTVLCIMCDEYQGRDIELRYCIWINWNIPLEDTRTEKKKDTNHLVT